MRRLQPDYMSGNETPFKRFEFREFMKRNGTVRIRVSHHPQSNGLAQRAVRTVKDALKIIGNAELTTSLPRVLCNYRNTPQRSGLSPSDFGLPVAHKAGLIFPAKEPSQHLGQADGRH